MTCIVGIETPQGVMLGGDSIGGDATYWTAMDVAEPKVFHVGPYVLGFTTSFRMGDLLRYQLKLPPPKGRLHRHMVTAVVPAIRALFKDAGFATTKDGADIGGDFLIGVAGQLFHVQSNYSVQHAIHGYGAAGIGAQTALGALAVTEGLSPQRRLKSALAAAALHNMGVRGPWHIARGRP